MEPNNDLEMQWPVDWREHIHCDPDILVGKPVVKGTRLLVEFLVGLFAGGVTEEEVLENYPTLSREGLRAAFAYASDFIAEQVPRAES